MGLNQTDNIFLPAKLGVPLLRALAVTYTPFYLDGHDLTKGPPYAHATRDIIWDHDGGFVSTLTAYCYRI